MAIEVTVLKRKFEIERNGKSIYLDDPNPEMSIEEVCDFYSSTFPELMNSNYITSELDNNLVIKFKTIAGTKG